MSTASIWLRVAEHLRLLLLRRLRTGVPRLDLDDRFTLGHPVQAAGIPLTGVGTLLARQVPVDAGYRPWGGATVEVLRVARPQPLPPGPPRFLLDVDLGSLARRTRKALPPAELARVSAALETGTRRRYPGSVRCIGRDAVYWRRAQSERLDAMIDLAGASHPR